MKVDTARLAKLDTDFQGYLSGDKIDAFFAEYEIPFATGHWCSGPFFDRFATTGYNPDLSGDVIAQIERCSQAGVKGIEFHNDVFLDADGNVLEDKIKATVEACKKHGLTPTNMNTNLWTDSKWKLGSVTSMDAGIRKDALAVALQAVDIAHAVGCSSVALWAGADGWDYNFQVNYGKQLGYFIQAAIEINNKAKDLGLRFGIEGKPHEPREGGLVVTTSPKAMLIAKTVNEACGGTNMGICIDYGHEMMTNAEPADMVYTAKAMGVPLVNFHLNTAKAHSNDEDRLTGTGDIWRQTEFFYAAVDTGYEGWFGEDQFTYRMNPTKAIALSREFFANLMKKALQIYARKAELEKAQATGDAGETIDVVKKFLL